MKQSALPTPEASSYQTPVAISVANDAILTSTATSQPPKIAALYGLLRHSPLKAGAVAALRVKDVYRDGRLLDVVRLRHGRGLFSLAALPAWVRKAISAQAAEKTADGSSHLFSTRKSGGKAMSQACAFWQLQQLFKAAGLPDMSPKALHRQAALDHFASNAYNLKATAGWLGVSIPSARNLLAIDESTASTLPKVRKAPEAEPKRKAATSDVSTLLNAFQAETVSRLDRLEALPTAFRELAAQVEHLVKGLHVSHGDADRARRLDELTTEHAKLAKAHAEAQEMIVEFGNENQSLTSQNKALATELTEIKGKLTDVVQRNRALAAEVEAARETAARLPKLQSPSRLTDIPVAASLLYSDRIIFDRRARQSLSESPYEDVAGAWESVRLLGEEFFAHLSGQTDFAPVQAKLLSTRITFNSHSSETTQGMFRNDYIRQYNGRSVPLHKHLCLGNARDPKHCWRLYFEWIPEQRRIVVFHAGRHLPTQFS